MQSPTVHALAQHAQLACAVWLQITPHARAFIEELLVTDPKKRRGSSKQGGAEVRAHKWLETVQFKKLEARQLPAPFLPEGTTATAEGAASTLGDEYVFFPEDHPAFDRSALVHASPCFVSLRITIVAP